MSKSKNIFTIISLLTMDALMLHLVCLSIGMLINKVDNRLLGISSRIISVFFLVHMITGIIRLIKTENKKITYIKYNYKTLIQRISAILMIILLVFHIILSKDLENINNLTIDKKIFVFIIELLFFIDCLLHIFVSSPKAMLSMGKINSEEDVKKQEKIELIKCSILGLLSIISLIIYVFGGVR